MSNDIIRIGGAREHNLKNITVSIPRNQLVVITGLSGSGKSSLAFDTLYAEGQRRYVESLSSYARQFLGLMEKPDVDYIEGLSPAISIEQKTTHRNPRSTVGTVTEIYDYLRLLFARIGKPRCYICGTPVTKMTVQQIVDSILAFPEGTKIQILAPLMRERKGEFRELFREMRHEGFVRARIDGKIIPLSQDLSLSKNQKHTIELVIDRLVIQKDIVSRLTDSIELALKMGNGNVLIEDSEGKEYRYSEHFACPNHPEVNYEELSPRMFSFNNPLGACPACSGLGTMMEISPDLLVPNKKLSLLGGAIVPLGEQPRGNYYSSILKGLAEEYHFKFTTPWNKLPPEVQKVLLYGTGNEEITISYESDRWSGQYKGAWEGVVNNLKRRYRQTQSPGIRAWIEKFMRVELCHVCQGSRLKHSSLSVYIHDKNIDDISKMSIQSGLEFFKTLPLDTIDKQIAGQILNEIYQRYGFLVNVGLGYLTLNRSAGTLSGGEAQRIRLATQIGSQLTGVLYILDEPSIGLHQKDNGKLLDTLKKLRDLGNSIIVIEHDQETMEAADWIVDMGPGAGIKGGEIVANGVLDDIIHCPESLTGLYLCGKRKIPVPEKRNKGNGKHLTLYGARGNNLKSITVSFPLGRMICVTGVSGSGKSTLINETLVPILNRHLMHSNTAGLPYDSISGIEYLDKIINITQAPIGRTPRSNPATYTGVFTHIRQLFASLPDSKLRGYSPGRFSFNVKGGRCESCNGDGIKKIEMHFLPDVYVRCEECKGKRYNRETLQIKYRGKTIADILDMTVVEALEFFKNHPSIKRKLKTLYEVGLGYIHLGQQATTLSGGEAQRIKLATELSRIGTGRTIYILDEPTTGLHFADVEMLLNVLHKLVKKGNTVLVIEHNLDVIKTADYIIDLGLDGGDDGGQVVVAGEPEEIIKHPISYTAEYLRKILIQ
ncbi:MAG: excinuclease ABC subunit UvrA [Candidatus Marinimicrobia bacterium]|nr:excinuclease ABC subunit UvrA [Candidatus Neomarinimicrobiota bacterium]